MKATTTKKAITPPESPLLPIPLERDISLRNPHHIQAKRSVPICASESLPQFGQECSVDGVFFSSSILIYLKGAYRFILI